MSREVIAVLCFWATVGALIVVVPEWTAPESTALPAQADLPAWICPVEPHSEHPQAAAWDVQEPFTGAWFRYEDPGDGRTRAVGESAR